MSFWGARFRGNGFGLRATTVAALALAIAPAALASGAPSPDPAPVPDPAPAPAAKPAPRKAAQPKVVATSTPAPAPATTPSYTPPSTPSYTTASKPSYTPRLRTSEVGATPSRARTTKPHRAKPRPKLPVVGTPAVLLKPRIPEAVPVVPVVPTQSFLPAVARGDGSHVANLARDASLVLAILLLVLAAVPMRTAMLLRPLGPHLAEWRLHLAGTGLMIGCAILADAILNNAS